MRMMREPWWRPFRPSLSCLPWGWVSAAALTLLFFFSWSWCDASWRASTHARARLTRRLAALDGVAFVVKPR